MAVATEDRAHVCGLLALAQVCFIYVTHSGRSALSSRGDLIAVSNLWDSFDIYLTQDRSLIRTIKTTLKVNLPLPLMFIGNEDTLLVGSSCGSVLLLDARIGETLQRLDHPGNDFHCRVCSKVTDGII